jgi:predicted Zn-dependent peptidase
VEKEMSRKFGTFIYVLFASYYILFVSCVTPSEGNDKERNGAIPRDANSKPNISSTAMPAKPAFKSLPSPVTERREASILVKKLSNGIPVIVQRLEGSTLSVMKFVWPADSQTERRIVPLALASMTDSSKDYPAERIRKELFAASAILSYSDDDPGQYCFEMAVPNEHFENLMAMALSLFSNPISSASSLQKARENNTQPNGVVAQLRYAAMQSVFDESFGDYFRSKINPRDYIPVFETATTDIIDANIEKMLSNPSMFVVISGDINGTNAITKLESAIGSRPLSSKPPAAQKALRWRSNLSYVSLSGESSLSHFYGAIEPPPLQSQDYPAFLLCLRMLDALLLDELRSRQSSCYGAWTETNEGLFPWAGLVVYGTYDPLSVKRAIDKVVAQLAAGTAIGRGASDRTSIDKRLEAFKSATATAIYQSIQSARGSADAIASSYFRTGDPLHALRVADAVWNITLADVSKAARKYLIENPVAWSLAANPTFFKSFDKSQFLKFSQPK